MSAREIVEELPRLSNSELAAFEERIREIKSAITVGGSLDAFRETLLDAAGSCEGLPSDYASEHYHYLYGRQKKREQVRRV